MSWVFFFVCFFFEKGGWAQNVKKIPTNINWFYIYLLFSLSVSHRTFLQAYKYRWNMEIWLLMFYSGYVPGRWRLVVRVRECSIIWAATKRLWHSVILVGSERNLYNGLRKKSAHTTGKLLILNHQSQPSLLISESRCLFFVVVFLIKSSLHHFAVLFGVLFEQWFQNLVLCGFSTPEVELSSPSTSRLQGCKNTPAVFSTWFTCKLICPLWKGDSFLLKRTLLIRLHSLNFSGVYIAYSYSIGAGFKLLFMAPNCL